MWMTIQETLRDPNKRRGPGFFFMWIAWVLVGSIFYGAAPESNLGAGKGFYMAINIGYSIGFGYPAESYDPYLWFSTIYVLVGSSFVAVALGFFADKISEDHDNWFTNLVQAQQYEKNIRQADPLTFIKAVVVQYEPQIRAVAAWLIWVGIMVAYSLFGMGWSFIQALYFAISTLSTGGHWGLTEFGTPDWLWPVTAFFAMLGVPIMAVAMAQLATMLVDEGDLDSTKAQIVEDVTGEELLMLRKFGLENGDGVIDSAEYIILCMVRMGQDPQLIEFIAKRFQELDDDNSGYLTIEEITGGKYYLKNGQICSKKGEILGLKGVKNFSSKNLNLDISEGSSEA